MVRTVRVRAHISWPALVEAAVLEARRQHRAGGRVGLRSSWQRRGRAGAERVVGVSVSAAGRDGGAGRAAGGARDWKRWERGRPNELWQIDTVGGFVITDGSQAKALTGVDDHSRYCVRRG